MNRSLSKTLRGSPVVVAPGKVFLVGEYAVLEGGAAVLASVNRYAVAQYLPDLTPESPVIARLRGVDVDRLTPIEALTLLAELTREAVE